MTATPGKTIDDLIVRIDEAIKIEAKHGRPLIMTLGGPSASGKSTTMSRLTNHFGAVSTLSTDDYYIGRTAMETKLPWPHKSNFDHPRAVNMGLLIGHLCKLRMRERIERPIYNMLTSEPTLDTVTVEPHPLIIVEGIFANNPDISYWARLKVTTMRSAEARLARRIERDRVRTGQSEEEIRSYFTEVAEYNYQLFCAANDRNIDFFLST
jgi:uridine kinase